MKVDLHCHSSYSDNPLTIEEIMQSAKRQSVEVLAVTDHDTTIHHKEAQLYGEQYGIDVIPGIEISAFDFINETRVHILGLYVQENHPALREICDPILELRHHNSVKSIQLLRQHGYDITVEEVAAISGKTGIFKQHIMEVLMNKGYCNSLYGPLYKQLFSAQDGIAYFKMNYVDVCYAIQAIREAGGIAILAHPGLYNNWDSVGKWVEIGLEGIEVYHPNHGEEDEILAIELAQKYGLLMTGGSDFHGRYSDHGCVLGDKNPGMMVVEELKRRKEAR